MRLKIENEKKKKNGMKNYIWIFLYFIFRDFNSLNKDDVLRNNELAFRIAEQHLDIPALLDADDMASCTVPDRLSILTYLSQFYQHFGGELQVYPQNKIEIIYKPLNQLQIKEHNYTKTNSTCAFLPSSQRHLHEINYQEK